MKDLAIAYAMKRRAGKGMNPKLEESHKGGENCMHCGGPVKMAMGGMVKSEDNMFDVSGDMDAASKRFDMENAPEDSQVLNEMSDTDPMFDMDEEEAKKEVKPSGMLLSRILGGLRRAHSGKA
jgi:hypothetical protein